jgi:serine/threonine protein kinase
MAALKSPITFATTFAVYNATEIAGNGGNGIVYQATDETGAPVAIKLLSTTSMSDERRKRFKNELLFGMKAQHTNVVRVLDHGLYQPKGKDAAPFYVMPFYGESMRTVMGKGIAPANVLPLFAQILDGVEAAHKMGVVHRDLKPENILYDPAKKQLVIADFGIAEFAEEELYTLVETRPNARLANFNYAAPEQKRRGASCDQRTDVFALGLILNEMFTGVVPQGTGYALISGIAPALAYLDDLVGEMLRQSIADRPATIDAIKQELIGRRNDFITRQELSALSKQVIPRNEIDDPIVLDPIRVVSAVWKDGTLSMKLSQHVNPNWVQILQFGAYSKSSIMGRGPETYRIVADQASVSVPSEEAQRAIDFFKSWLPHAHELYKRQVAQNKERDEKAARDQLAREIRAREEQLTVNSRLRV